MSHRRTRRRSDWWPDSASRTLVRERPPASMNGVNRAADEIIEKMKAGTYSEPADQIAVASDKDRK